MSPPLGEPGYVSPAASEPSHVSPPLGEPGYVSPAASEPSHGSPPLGEPGYVSPAASEPSHGSPPLGEPGYVSPAASEPCRLSRQVSVQSSAIHAPTLATDIMCGTQEELDYLMIDDLMFDKI